MARLGKYEVLEQIGHGAMGVVYKARDPLIERVVAIKTISADLDTEPELRARFFREARTAGRLSHKNIVTIYDLGEQEGKAYMVMEYLDGEDLNAWILRRQGIPLERILRVMLDVLDGLSHAHEMGVIHRDIKPGNIFVTRTGDTKILDFGLARLASSDITRTRSVMGTPNYMSPEQIRSDVTDQRSDIFSVGSTFYELLTYRKPFRASSLPATLFKIMQENPEPPDTVDHTIPHELSAIVLRAMEKDPANRYQNAAEMARDLERFRIALEGQKQELRRETEEAVTTLNRLLTDNREILQQYPQSPSAVPEIAPGTVDSGEITRADLATEVPYGYTEMRRVREKAAHDIRVLTLMLEEHKKAESIFDQAAVLEERGELDKAWELAQSLPSEARQQPKGLAVIGRLQEKLLERSRAEEKRRRVARLFEEARLCHDGGKLSESLGRLRELSALDPRHAEASRLRDRITAQLEEERRRRETAERAEELFRRAKARLLENDLAGALRSAGEVLALVPDHKDARELASDVERRIAEIKAEEERRTRIRAAVYSARNAFQSASLSEARLNAERALKLDPQSSEASEILRLVAAAEEKIRAEAEKRTRIEELLQHAGNQVDSGADGDALRNLAALLELDPANTGALELQRSIIERREAAARAERERRQRVASSFLRIRAARRSGRLDEAIALAGTLLTEEPGLQAIRPLLKRLEDEKARKLQEELEKKAQDLVSTAARLAAGDNLEQAVVLLENAGPGLDVLPSVRQALEQHRTAAKLLQEARERAERERKEKIRALVLQAKSSNASGKLEDAIEFAQAALAEDSVNSEIRALLESFQRERVRRQKEQEEFERRKQSLLTRARELGGQEKLDEAVSALEKAEPALASSPDVLQLLNQYRAAVREREQARIEAERRKKERVASLLAQARAAKTARNWDQAIEHARAVLAEDAGHLEARRILSGAEKELQDRMAREATARRAQSVLAQAKEHADRENFEAALSILQAADSEVASTGGVRQALSTYRQAARRIQAQREESARREREEREKALQVDRYLAGAKEAFGRGDYARCEEQINRLLALDPNDARARDLLSSAREHLARLREEQLRRRQVAEAMTGARRSLSSGKLREAFTLVERALKLNPEDREAAELKIRIKSAQAQAREREEKRGRAERLRDEAARLCRNADFDAAARALGEAESLWPESAVSKKLRKQIACARDAARAKPSPAGTRARRYAPATVAVLAVAIAGGYFLAHRRPPDVTQNTASLTAAPNVPAGSKAGASPQEAPTLIPRANTPVETETQYRGAAVTPQPTKTTAGAGSPTDGLKHAADTAGPQAAAEQPLSLSAADAMRKAGEDKSKAEQAEAAKYAGDELDRASVLEAEAIRLYRERQYGPATARFLQASEAYRRAETSARSNASAAEQERLRQEERKQAVEARQAFEAARAGAVAAGADTGAATGSYREALTLAGQAQKRLDQGDFAGARGTYGAASNAIQSVISGLASERQEWEGLKNSSNLAELLRFVRKYPSSPFAAQAAQQIESVEWQMVGKEDPAAARAFLQKYPNGPHAREAARRIEEAEWNALDRKNPATLREYIQKHPGGAFVAAARDEIAKADQAQKHDSLVQGIQQTLSRYRDAFERMDAAAVQAIWPGMSREQLKTIQDAFKETESIQLQLSAIGEPKIDGDTAVVTCRRAVLQKYRHGGDVPSKSTESVVTLTLRKQGNDWMIESIR